MFKNPFSFEGRIRRLEYGLSVLIYYAFLFAIGMIADFLPENTGSVLILILIIPVGWFVIAQNTKRCHDRGNSGFYQLIPLYGLWLLFADGDIGPNEYGLNPKGLGNFSDIDELGNDLESNQNSDPS